MNKEDSLVTIRSVLECWYRYYSLGVVCKQAILETETFPEVALSVDGLVELVYELVNSSCMLVSTIINMGQNQVVRLFASLPARQ